ncbi:hypothetical protein EW093_17025 [Thiospirochaeta perfilievii]|uniref:Uncharacterized protein n=1 Tax=Thiospirochaeta perfilievii TaxID=252967 RepID=A0A5C1QIF0_9SPIO|nr:hypothetical protein EW093_17025 [Thiospirochaeta perfilievii]
MGENNYIEIEEDSYKSIPFINNSIADVIKATDLVISRAGLGYMGVATVGFHPF